MCTKRWLHVLNDGFLPLNLSVIFSVFQVYSGMVIGNLNLGFSLFPYLGCNQKWSVSLLQRNFFLNLMMIILLLLKSNIFII